MLLCDSVEDVNFKYLVFFGVFFLLDSFEIKDFGSKKTKGPKQDFQSKKTATVTYAWGRRTLIYMSLTTTSIHRPIEPQIKLLPNTLIKHNSFVLQKGGVEKNLGIGKLVDYEIDLLQSAMPELLANIKKGEDFVNQ